MDKLIIENRTDLSMVEAMPYINRVLEMGRISNDNKQYCYATTFYPDFVVCSDLNKKSDRLILTKTPTTKPGDRD